MNSIIRQMVENMENLPLPMQQEALDFVCFLKLKQTKNELAPPKQEPNGMKLTRLMEEIASRGTAFKEIEDPSEWQREIRKDRSMPGRAE